MSYPIKSEPVPKCRHLRWGASRCGSGRQTPLGPTGHRARPHGPRQQASAPVPNVSDRGGAGRSGAALARAVICRADRPFRLSSVGTALVISISIRAHSHCRERSSGGGHARPRGVQAGRAELSAGFEHTCSRAPPRRTLKANRLFSWANWARTDDPVRGPFVSVTLKGPCHSSAHVCRTWEGLAVVPDPSAKVAIPC